MKNRLLDIGTTIYTIEESMTDRWFSHTPYHYEIVHGKINRINRGGFTEYVVQTYNRLGKTANLRYLQTSRLRNTFWLTEAEAIEAAERMTTAYEKHVKERLMRPWRKNEEQII